MSNFYIGNELSLFKEAVNWKKYWLKHIDPYVSGHVLEVGAGIGNNSLLLLANPNIEKIDALEPDAELHQQFIQFTKASNHKIQSRPIYLSDIPLEEKFDTILYIDVLEHIEDDKRELQDAFSHLKVNGHLVILSPAFNFLFSNFDRSIGHFRRYSKRTLSQIIPETLEPVFLHYLDSMGALASLSNKAFLKQEYPTKKQIRFWDQYIVRTSRIIDPLIFHSVGKTIVGVWKKNATK